LVRGEGKACGCGDSCQAELLAEGAIVVAEHGKKLPPAEQFKAKNGGVLERYRLHLQGDAALSFYRAAISK